VVPQWRKANIPGVTARIEVGPGAAAGAAAAAPVRAESAARAMPHTSPTSMTMLRKLTRILFVIFAYNLS
jgi:hypothetical protein